MHSEDVRGARHTIEAGENSPGNGSESAEDSLPLRSLFDLDEDPGVHVRWNELSLPTGMSFDSWWALGSKIFLIANCSTWWIGDWLVYGEQTYSDRYEQALTDTSLGYQTLRNYAWVVRKFPVSRRRDTLSFGHHAEVAALPGDEQDAWLARAEQSNWSRNQLRRELRVVQLANRQAAGGEGSASTRALKIDVPAERHDRWQSAAERKKCSVADWIIATLDRAASGDLSTEIPQGSADTTTHDSGPWSMLQAIEGAG
jgi:hypothetical protein